MRKWQFYYTEKILIIQVCENYITIKLGLATNDLFKVREVGCWWVELILGFLYKIDNKIYRNGCGPTYPVESQWIFDFNFFGSTSPWRIHAVPNLIFAIGPVRWGSLHSYSVWIHVWVASCPSLIQINSGYFYISCRITRPNWLRSRDNNPPLVLGGGLRNIYITLLQKVFYLNYYELQIGSQTIRVCIHTYNFWRVSALSWEKFLCWEGWIGERLINFLCVLSFRCLSN